MPGKRSIATGKTSPAVRWRALLDFGNASLGLLNEQGELLYASAPLARLCGRPVRTGHRAAASGFIHAEDRRNTEAALHRCLDTRAATSFTARLESGPGEYRWIEASLTNRLADRALHAVIVHLRDLTLEREREERYAAIFSVAPIGIAQLGMDRRIQFVNDRLCAILDYAREELIGKRLKDFSHPEDNDMTEAAVVGLIGGRSSSSELEKRFVRGDGGVVWARLTMANPHDPRFLVHRVVVIEDISARKDAEARLEQLSQLHVAASEINEAILRTRQPRELFHDACDILVKHCHFEIAAIRMMKDGILDLEGHAGPLVDELCARTQGLPVTRPDGPGLGPEAFRSGRPCVTNDYTYDARFFGRDTPEQRAGLRSAAAFPLKRSGSSIGLLMVASRQKDVFDDALTGLIEHVAENVSFALEKFEQQAEHERSEAALHESEARFRGLVELSSDMYWEQDEECRFTRIAESNVATQLSREGLLGRRRWELPGAATLNGAWEDHLATLRARLPFRSFEYRHRKPSDGSMSYISATGEPIYDGEGRFVGYRGTARDVTAAKRDEWELRRFRTALDQSSELICLTDAATGRILDFNDAVCHTLGYRREELIGRSLDFFVLGRTPEESRLRNQALLEEPERRDQTGAATGARTARRSKWRWCARVSHSRRGDRGVDRARPHRTA